jgi:hypothetical protein
MYETRHQFREDLKELERQTLEEIDVVVAQLDRALASLSNHDIELAGLVVAAEVRIDARCLEIHQGVLLLLARQTPVAGDLPWVTQSVCKLAAPSPWRGACCFGALQVRAPRWHRARRLRPWCPRAEPGIRSLGFEMRVATQETSAIAPAG